MKTRNWIVASLMASVALPVGQEAYSQNLALEEIVVTARKRDENIYEIPVSVSAFSDAMLSQAGIDNAQDLSNFTSGLDFRQYDFGGRNTPNIRIRGMIQQVITPSTQIGALFWDGSYIGGGGSFVPLGGLERVEIIKGPQTAYFGRNTFAGAINYIPKRAGDEWEGDVTVSWSPTDADEYTASVGISGPIGDRVGVSLWGGYEREGGDFEFGDGEPFAQFKDKSVNGTIFFDPTEDLSFRLTGYYTRANDTTTGGSVPFTTPAGACDIIYRGNYENVITGELTPFERDLSQLTFGSFCGEFPNAAGFQTPKTRFPTAADLLRGPTAIPSLTALNPRSEEYDIIRTPQGGLGGWHQTNRIQLHGDYDFADHTVSFLTSRASTGTTTRVDQFFGNSGTPPGDRILIVGTETAIREFYYEAKVVSPQDQRFRYLFGASDYNQHYNLFTDPARSPQQVDRQRSTTFSVFGSFDYDITDDITLSVEGRWTDEKFIAIEQGPVGGGRILADGTVCTTSVCNEENAYDAFLPRVILNYTPFDGASTYVSWSQSKLLGLATQAASISANAPDLISPAEVDAIGAFTPEQKATQYEFGWKQQWENANMTLAVFHTRWKNQVVPAVIFLPGGAGTSSFRAPGDSEYTGFDLEGNVQFTDWLSVTGQVAYSNGVMTDYSNRGSNEFSVLGSGTLAVESDGNGVRNHPEWSGSLSPVVTGEWGDREWFIRADYIYIGKHFTDYSNLNINRARKQTNLRVGMDLLNGSMIELFGTNIFNSKRLPTTSGTTFGFGGRKIFTGPYQAFEWGVKLTAAF